MIPAFIFDIVLFIIFVGIALNGYRKGFVKSLLGLACLLISVICAAVFTPCVSTWLNDNHVEKAITETVRTSVYSALEDSDTDGKAEKLFSVIDQFVFSDKDEDMIADSYANEILNSENTESSVDKICSEIARSISKPLCNSLAFFLIFIITGIAVRIAAIILDKVFTLPVLKQANKLLGLVFGVICAVVTMMILARVFVCVLPWLSSMSAGKVGERIVEDSVFLSFFCRFNIFREIIKDISVFL